MTELMSSGVELMFAGMGIVFLFLTMLVVAINIMSSLVQRFFPDAPTQVATATRYPAALIKASLLRLPQRCISTEASINKVKNFRLDD